MLRKDCLVFSRDKMISSFGEARRGCLATLLCQGVGRMTNVRLTVCDCEKKDCLHLSRTWKDDCVKRRQVMFSVESAVQQVKPDFILRHVLEAEEGQWTKVHLEGDDLESSLGRFSGSQSTGSDHSDPGVVLLKHGTSVRKIHNYFSQLEFRKCCLHLAGRKTTFQSMRVVLSSANLIDDGTITRRRAPTYVTHLEDKELRAFKHAYLCAAYPVLAAPDPPSPLSPSPVNPVTHSVPSHRLAELRKAGTGAVTPLSLHDSGLEESEDLAFVPSESICAHLQRAFRLTDEKFRDYRYLINKTYVKKTAQKLLAEELAGQLSVLENNCHPFYRPQDFTAPNGYDIWRKSQQSHITELLGKFWHYSLPFPRDAQDLIAELHSVHDDYKILLRKLLTYEGEFQRQTEEEGNSVLSFLSSASVRLLKEFGLRYGIGEQYRRILYLEQLSADFSPCLWYLRHVLCVLNSVLDMLPADRRTLSMVHRELEMLQSGLVRLAAQASKTLGQMKSVFPGNKPAGGVEMLIMLLQKVRDIRLYLAYTLQEPPALRTELRAIVQGNFLQTYEKCKTVIRTELRQSRDTHVCPRLLNALIMEMRDEVHDYKNNFEATFAQYFDITVMAAKAFYTFLMKDVDLLCEQEKLRDNAIDLRMLALVHRLNQLDHDWTAYITVQDQSWRRSFQVHVDRWGHALGMHVQDLVLEIVAGDMFATQPLNLASEGSTQSPSNSSSPKARSISITPSVNSAFSSIPSTPREDSSLNNRHTTQTPDKTKFARQKSGDTDTSYDDQEQVTESSDFLNFADKRRPCASLPVFCDKPAMVRAMSDLQMLTGAHSEGLRAASALDDLRLGQNSTITTQLRGVVEAADAYRTEEADTDAGRESGQSQRDMEGHILDTVSDFGEMDDGISEMEANALGVEEEFSDSDDEEFSFPPIAEVTDLNISEPKVSSSIGSDHPNSLQGTTAVFSIGASSLSYRQNKSVKNQPAKPKSDSSLLHPHTSSLLSASPGSMPTTGPQRDPPRLQPQLSGGLQPHPQSPFRRVSTGSTSASISSERDQPYLRSLHSTISFPSPTHSHEVIIPVSGSVIDVAIILHRTLGFSSSLCHTIFPQQQQPSLDHGSESERNTSTLQTALESFRESAHLNIVKVLCQGLGVYVDNMLCLDLCAVPKDIAQRVIGSMLVEHAIGQQKAGCIWGCRHQLEGHRSCFAFHNRNATFLCDRYEPITQKMCVRINNVTVCQHYLDWCSKQTQATSHRLPVSADAAYSGGSDTEPATAKSTTAPADTESDDISTSKQQCIEQTKTHLKSVWNALCRLLAFRINLFLRDGMSLLLSLKPGHVPVEVGLMPVTSFLRSHLDALSSWLYSSSFRRVIEFLWIYIVQDIEKEACRLSRLKNSKLTPHVLLQTLSHLMRFMNNCEKGITRELMLSQAEDVMIKLQLLTLATLNLIALYYRLLDMWSVEGGRLSANDTRQPMRTSARALHQLRHDLQTRRKCFSGAQLVRWIVRHSELFMSPDELSLCGGRVVMSDQGAEDIAQMLLDQQFILDVERENSVSSRRSSVSGVPHYPEVSIHSQHGTRSGRDIQDRESDSSADREVTPTPSSQLSTVWSPASHRHVVAAEVHATDRCFPSGPSHTTGTSTGDSTGYGNLGLSRPPILTTSQPEISQEATVFSVVTAAPENSAHQMLSPQSQCPNGRFVALGDTVPVVQTAVTGREKVQVSAVRQVTGPTGSVDLPNKVHTVQKPFRAPSDFEDSGMGEGLETNMSDNGADIPDSEVEARPSSKASSLSRAVEEKTPSESENSTTPLAQSPTHLESAGGENDLQEGHGYEADHSSALTTPSSMRSLTPFSPCIVFNNSHKRFYFMPASYDPQPPRSSSHQPAAQLLSGVLSYLNRSLATLKNSQETSILAEKCFNLKIKPVSILGIIHSRRTADSIAQNFLLGLSADVLAEVRSNIQSRSAECSVL